MALVVRQMNKYEKRSILDTVRHTITNWIRHVLRINCLLRDAILGLQGLKQGEEEEEEDNKKNLTVVRFKRGRKYWELKTSDRAR